MLHACTPGTKTTIELGESERNCELDRESERQQTKKFNYIWTMVYVLGILVTTHWLLYWMLLYTCLFKCYTEANITEYMQDNHRRRRRWERKKEEVYYTFIKFTHSVKRSLYSKVRLRMYFKSQYVRPMNELQREEREKKRSKKAI